MKVLVTGMGVVSAIGLDTNSNLNSLLAGNSGIAPLQGIENMRKEFVGGQVQYDDAALRNLLSLQSDLPLHRSTLLALIAAKEAWGNRSEDATLRTGIIFGTTIGGVDLTEAFHSGGGQYKVDFRRTHNQGFGTEFLADHFGIRNYKATISTACSTAANAILVGARLIRAGILDRALVGGAEAITNYTLNGFDSLMLYDQNPCMPFDADRKGLNLGEGAGFLLLENEKGVRKTENHVVAELKGWANTCDAYHQTASSPTGVGAALAITETLKMAKMAPESIGYINAHGTGTPNNDLSESMALSQIFGDTPPPFSSTKANTGHTLAAAGSIEAIYAILALKNGIIFPNLRHKTAMPEINFQPQKEVIRNRNVHAVLSNSFGFGGNCTELLFVA